MFKFSNIFGACQSADSLTKNQAGLLQLTNEQAMSVAAGTTEPTVKETPTDKPTVTTTTSSGTTSDTIPTSAGRPPFN